MSALNVPPAGDLPPPALPAPRLPLPGRAGSGGGGPVIGTKTRHSLDYFFKPTGMWWCWHPLLIFKTSAILWCHRLVTKTRSYHIDFKTDSQAKNKNDSIKLAKFLLVSLLYHFPNTWKWPKKCWPLGVTLAAIAARACAPYRLFDSRINSRSPVNFRAICRPI